MTGNDAQGMSPDCVQFTDQQLDWREALRMAGQPLIDNGTIEPAYIDAVIATAEKMGPYFDFGKGVAMPHSRPEGHVHRVGLSFLRTRTPVLLLDDPKHPIDVFIMLATPDNTAHMTVLRTLAGVLTDNAAVDALKDATDPNQVLAILANDH